MDEKKIVIVSDENGIVAFDDITIKHDTINRAEVEEVEKAIKSENTKRLRSTIELLNSKPS